MRLISLCAIWVGIISAGAAYAEPVDYLRDIKPLLARKCYSCHGALKQKGGLRVDTASLTAKGGTAGPAVVAGKSAESLLIAAVTGAEGIQRMPLEGEPLSEAEISLLKAWIDQGAQAPAEALPADPLKHWSFQLPQRPAVPVVKNPAWVRNPIDAFIAAEHEQRGLTPRPQADKPTLLRRVYLDLSGLPPTRAEVQEFLKDEAPDAYEKVVKRLLESVHYGERWGRHWMDVWRYSDWDGYAAEVRESKPHIWRWRDWIIESLNADKPYNQMLVEMLAGDEVAPEDPNVLRATGFLVRNWFMFNRNVWLDMSVEHTSKAFIGMTLNCARCHDHMYDPVSQEDYYRFRAFFEPHNVRTDRVPGQADLTKDGNVRVFDADAGTPTYLFTRGDDKQPVKDRPLAPGVPQSLAGEELKIAPVALTPQAYYPSLRSFVQAETRTQASADLERARETRDKGAQVLAVAKQRLAEYAAPGTPAPNATPAFLSDDFGVAKPETWKVGAGDWEYQSGRLLQKAALDQWCELIALKPHPADFHARFKFKITGGKVYKSVGLSWDSLESRDFHAVYLSPFAGGPKLQLFHRRGGQDVYPGSGAKSMPVELNREYELEVLVRGQLVNVLLDKKLQLVYTLPESRAAGTSGGGRFSLFTYDATAEFLKVSLQALPPDIALAETVSADTAVPAVATPAELAQKVTQAEDALAFAEKGVLTSQAAAASVEARIAADQARFAVPPAVNAKELALAANKAERELALRQAEHNLLQAEQQAAVAKLAVKPDADAAQAEAAQKKVTEAEKKLAETRQARESAQAAAEKPDENYKPLGEIYPAHSTGRRTALANWIASAQNPLTARVAVNHLWLRHFGSPLVPTVFDFGVNGKAPTHPQLLDWLATEYVSQGWRMKQLHFLMVTSNAYRMQSTGTGDSNRNLDPENQFLWRANVRRMEAEVIRDSALLVAGQLDRTLYGPELDQNLGLTVPRRSIYFRSSKEKKVTFLSLFDSPNVVECYRRTESIAPQQALAMANSALTLAQARLLAGTLSTETGMQETPEKTTAFIQGAFAQILCRAPTAAEQAECQKFLSEQSQLFASGKGLTPFTAGAAAVVKPAADPHQRARENLVHVLLNHNDFLTIR